MKAAHKRWGKALCIVCNYIHNRWSQQRLSCSYIFIWGDQRLRVFFLTPQHEMCYLSALPKKKIHFKLTNLVNYLYLTYYLIKNQLQFDWYYQECVRKKKISKKKKKNWNNFCKWTHFTSLIRIFYKIHLMIWLTIHKISIKQTE